jgi:hypothetical protein
LLVTTLLRRLIRFFSFLGSGGYDRGDCLKTAMLYDPKTNQWSDLPSMLEHRGRLDIAVVDGKVYAIGGSSGNRELMSAEVYDERKKAPKWQRVPSCRLPRASCGQSKLPFICTCISIFRRNFSEKSGNIDVSEYHLDYGYDI